MTSSNPVLSDIFSVVASTREARTFWFGHKFNPLNHREVVELSSIIDQALHSDISADVRIALIKSQREIEVYNATPATYQSPVYKDWVTDSMDSAHPNAVSHYITINNASAREDILKAMQRNLYKALAAEILTPTSLGSSPPALKRTKPNKNDFDL